MANTHWFTNRGKKSLLTTAPHGATDFYVGLLNASGGTIPAGIDTEAEVQDLDTVTALLGVSGVTEVASTTRQNLASSTVTEDDTNNRANLDFANPTFSAVPSANPSYGGWISRGTGVNGDDLISVFYFASTITPNGSDITLTITDWARAV